MELTDKPSKHNIIIGTLVAALIGIIMLYFNVRAERNRYAESDYSRDWYLNGITVDINSVYTQDKSGMIISKLLPEQIDYSYALCFASTNSFFDVYIENEKVYSFSLPENLTGIGYGTAYHFVELSPEHANKNIRFNVHSTFITGRNGRINMMSIENPRDYFSRLAKGQVLSFVISTGISIFGLLVLIFRAFLWKRSNDINIMSIALGAIISGAWLAMDTGFLNVVTDLIIVSRVITYTCMYMCILPLAAFVYSITKERKRAYIIAVYAISGAYYLFIIIARSVFKRDLASSWMVRSYFAYVILIIGLIVAMLISNRKYCIDRNIDRYKGLFIVGVSSIAITSLIDITLYLSDIRSVAGYAIFSRIGIYVFLLCIGIEVIRVWAQDYAALKVYGYADELTGIGNRRAWVRFEESHKNAYPFGFIMCDINGLKRTNDKFGHEKGDELIRKVAEKMAEVFGKQLVFRVGGDEFFAYSFVTTLKEFEAQIERVKKLLLEKEELASVGGAYTCDKSVDPRTLEKRAEELMYLEKDKYYSVHDRRRR